MDVRYLPYRGQSGAVEGAVVAIRDISALQRAEERLRINSERLGLALSAGHQGMYDTDLQTGQVIVNGEYAGLFNDFEQVDEQFLARTGRNIDASIYSTQWTTYGNWGDLLENLEQYHALYVKETNTASGTDVGPQSTGTFPTE